MPTPHGAPRLRKLDSLRAMIATIRHNRGRSGDITLYKADVFLGEIGDHQRRELAPLDPLIPPIDMDALRELPAGSFGRAPTSSTDMAFLAMIRNFRRGFRLGRALDNMLARPLERRFEAPLDELRAELGFWT